jgi:hypothetical protein
MQLRKIRNFAISAVAGIVVVLSGAASAAAEIGNWAVPPQNNFLGCIGRGSPDDPGVPLYVQVNDRYGPYRSDQVVMVSDMSGMPVATLACDGPAVQFRLHPGSYRVVAFVADAVRSPEITVDVPETGASINLTMHDIPNQSFDTPNLD